MNIAVFVPHAGCPHTCSFCNQRVISGAVRVPEIFEVRELVTRVSADLRARGKSAEIAFFGGSFTAISAELLRGFCETAAALLHENADVISGIRCSTRPDRLSDEVCALLFEHGFTTVEIGAQSMNDTVLELNGRGHTSEDVRAAVERVRQHGMSPVLQMMTGLYGSCEAYDIATAEEFIALAPAAVRIYPTAVLRGSRLCELYEADEYTPPTALKSAVLCGKLYGMFKHAGIKVLRIGLHAQDGIEDTVIAGAYHPALGELAIAEYCRTEILKIMPKNASHIIVHCGKGCVSKVLGHGGCNKKYFANLGIRLTVTEADVKGKEIVNVLQGT